MILPYPLVQVENFPQKTRRLSLLTVDKLTNLNHHQRAVYPPPPAPRTKGATLQYRKQAPSPLPLEQEEGPVTVTTNPMVFPKFMGPPLETWKLDNPSLDQGDPSRSPGRWLQSNGSAAGANSAPASSTNTPRTTHPNSTSAMSPIWQSNLSPWNPQHDAVFASAAASPSRNKGSWADQPSPRPSPRSPHHYNLGNRMAQPPPPGPLPPQSRPPGLHLSHAKMSGAGHWRVEGSPHSPASSVTSLTTSPLSDLESSFGSLFIDSPGPDHPKSLLDLESSGNLSRPGSRMSGSGYPSHSQPPHTHHQQPSQPMFQHSLQSPGSMGAHNGFAPVSRFMPSGIPPRTTTPRSVGLPTSRRKTGMGISGGSASAPSSPVGVDDLYGPEGDMDPKRCSNVIKKLCSQGNITEVFGVLEDMMARGCVPDVKTVKTIMRACVKKLAWRRALQLLHMDHLPLDVVIYTMAINTCGKAGEWEQGLRVLREMDEVDGIAPNEVSYGTAISACGKAGRWEMALALLAEMKDRGLVLNDVCYGGAIDACGRAGQWTEALKLLNEMSVEGVQPNEVCYNSAISACGKAGEWEKAVSLLREMREKGLTPDELNYNSAISACGKAGQWTHAVRLLREMAVQGLSPDVVSYGAAIDACRKSGKYDRALALLAEMGEVGLAANEVCYHSAVTACSEAGRWNEALYVLREMVKQGLTPDAISYNAAVEACCKAGQWDALVRLLQQSGREETPLADQVYNNAVCCCGKHGHCELALKILQEMEYRGLSPSSASYAAVIDACGKAQQWEVLLAKMDRMREKGMLPDASCYNAAVRACAQASQWDRAVQLVQEMANRNCPVEQSTYTAVMNARNGGPDWEVTSRLMRNLVMGDGHAEPPAAEIRGGPSAEMRAYAAALEHSKSPKHQWESQPSPLASLSRMPRGDSSPSFGSPIGTPMTSPRGAAGPPMRIPSPRMSSNMTASTPHSASTGSLTMLPYGLSSKESPLSSHLEQAASAAAHVALSVVGKEERKEAPLTVVTSSEMDPTLEDYLSMTASPSGGGGGKSGGSPRSVGSADELGSFYQFDMGWIQ